MPAGALQPAVVEQLGFQAVGVEMALSSWRPFEFEGLGLVHGPSNAEPQTIHDEPSNSGASKL
jgi:hypothetical protein